MFNKLNQKVSLDNVDVNLLQLVRHRWPLCIGLQK